MTSLVRAELRKLLGRKLPLGVALVAGAFLLVNVVLLPLIARFAPEDDVAGLGDVLEMLKAPAGYVFAAGQAMQASVFVAVIVSAICMANEYSWHTLGMTLTLEPRRGRVLAAKVISLVLVTVGCAVALSAIGVLVSALTQPLLEPGTLSSFHDAWVPAVARVVIGGIPQLVVWVAIGVMLAVLTRSPAAAAGIGIALYIGTSIIALAPGVSNVLVSGNSEALQRVEGVSLAGASVSPSLAPAIPVWRALLVLTVYAVVTLAIARWSLRRRDVS